MTRPDLPSIRIDTSIVSPPQSRSPSPIALPNSHLSPESSDTKRRFSDTSDFSDVSSQPSISPDKALADAFEQEPDHDALTGTPFSVSPNQLALLQQDHRLAILHELGGLAGLELKLNVKADVGLSPDEDFSVREKAYGRNVLPDKKTVSLFKLILIAMSDKMLILLSVAAVISFSLGMYQSFGTPPEYDREGNVIPKVDWIEGVAILVAVVIVVLVGALNDWQKELQFAALNKKKDDRQVKVIRGGKAISISIFDVQAGDVMLLEPGDMIPVDGVLIQAQGVRCDESAATGESKSLKKITAEDAINRYNEVGPNAASALLEKIDPFVLSGSKVLEGFGHFLVTSVGQNSAHGKTMMDLRSGDDELESTPLQAKLNVIAEEIAKWGGGISVLLFFILLFRFLGELPNNHDTPTQKGESFMQYLITAVTLIAVAVPEGLPLAVTLALAFATKRMLKDNNLVRVLKSCETMGNATTICSDKTGTLTQNKMTVVEGTIGINFQFATNTGTSRDQDLLQDVYTDPFKEKLNVEDVVSIHSLLDRISEPVKNVLLQSIFVNTTAFEDAESEEIFVGSKTETALLGFARHHLAMGPLDSERSSTKIVQLFPFDSSKKAMGAVIQLPSGAYRLFIKGASEIVLAQAVNTVVTGINSDFEKTSADGIQLEEITSDRREYIENSITSYAEKSLRTIGLVYRDYESWPPTGLETQEDNKVQVKNFSDVFSQTTWVGLVGIMDPLRPGVTDAVKDCQRAGVVVRMVTGDNLITAKAIATECGIYTEGGLVLEGPKFRSLDPKERDAIIPKLQVLARSSPQDKRLLVQRLKRLGETVAVTGDGTNDAPALTMADVGFAMGIAGTEVAKEASDIILMDDNFMSIVKALLWGRAVNDAVKKFLQFQLTVNITAVTLTFISAIVSSEGESVMTAVQLLWVNLIMDTFAALALATDPPTRSLLDRKPSKRSDGLISITMWKMIIGQAILQLIITFVLHFAGQKIWGLRDDQTRLLQELDSMVFNTFVWLQFFNMFVNRRLDNKVNFFEGISKNKFFFLIAAIMCGGQILIMFVGGNAFSIVRLNGVQWAVSIVGGFLSVPVGLFLRLCVPDQVAYRIYQPVGIVFKFAWGYVTAGFKFLWPFKNKKATESNDDEEQIVGAGKDEDVIELRSPGGTVVGFNYEWNPAIEQVRADLIFMRRVRGGRLRELKFKPRQLYYRTFKSKSSLPQESSSVSSSSSEVAGPSNNRLPQSSPSSIAPRSRSGSSISALTMVPSIVGGAVAGWSPIERPGDRQLPPASGDEQFLSPTSATRPSLK
ncbi:hypothetical protein V1514DRAFT_145018 [Lipomyces japonicus]|uniref:uncharacterized protein n=1 Tax=Lipomyces japonicus TaxID=56871 RepID=UPI0034CD8097